jgi:hypothetical protein
MRPAIDVYDYISAVREAPDLFERCSMLRQAASTAGALDFLRLALRRAGFLRSWKYRKPLEQARLIAGEKFFSDAICAVSAAPAIRQDVEVLG